MMGIAISNSPQRVNDAHAHGANPREQAAGKANDDGKPEAKGQERFGKHQRWQEAGQSYADNRNQQVGKGQAENAANKSNDDGLRQHEEKNSAPGETDGLEHGKLANAFANRDGHGVAGHQQKGKEDDATDGQDQELDVSELFGETRGESGFGLGLRLKGRIAKFFVDGLGNGHRIVGAIKLDHVPSRGALDGGGRILVKIFPLQPKLALVATGLVAVINAVEIELRRAPAVESGFDRNAIAKFPMEACGGAGSGDGAHAVFHEIIPLLVRHHQLGHYLALIFGVDYKLGKEVLFILIDTAEPVIMSDRFEAG